MLHSVLCTPSLIFCMLAGCRNLRVQNRCCIHCFTPHNPMFCSRLAVPKVIYHGKELLPSRLTWNMFSLLSLHVYNCLLGRTTLVLVGVFYSMETCCTVLNYILSTSNSQILEPETVTCILSFTADAKYFINNIMQLSSYFMVSTFSILDEIFCPPNTENILTSFLLDALLL